MCIRDRPTDCCCGKDHEFLWDLYNFFEYRDVCFPVGGGKFREFDHKDLLLNFQLGIYTIYVLLTVIA